VSRTNDISTGTTGTPSSAQPAQATDPEASSNEMNCGEDNGGATFEGDEPQTEPPKVLGAAKMPTTRCGATADKPGWMSNLGVIPRHFDLIYS
jgi:hypothetical protein